LEGTYEIEEADQTEDDAPETRPSNETRFFHTFRIGKYPRTDRNTSLRELRTTHPSRSSRWLASSGAGDPRTKPTLTGGLHELQSAVIVVVTVALALAGCAHVQQQFAALPRCSRMKAGRR